MTTSGTRTVTINAPLAEVLAILHGRGNYASWYPGVILWEVLETDADGLPAKVHCVVRVMRVTDDCEVAHTNTDGSISWSLVAPTKWQKVNDGSWTWVDKGGTTEVTLALAFDGRWPTLWFIRNKILKDGLDGATKGLKAYAER